MNTLAEKSVRNWWVLVGVTAVIFFLIGFFVRPPAGNVNATNWYVGNKTNYYSNYTLVTNNPAFMREVYEDYARFMLDPFRFVQKNENIRVDLYKRYFEAKIQDYQLRSGPVAGIGWDLMRSSPAVLFGWEFVDTFGILGTATVSTNFGFSVFGTYKFNLY